MQILTWKDNPFHYETDYLPFSIAADYSRRSVLIRRYNAARRTCNRCCPPRYRSAYFPLSPRSWRGLPDRCFPNQKRYCLWGLAHQQLFPTANHNNAPTQFSFFRHKTWIMRHKMRKKAVTLSKVTAARNTVDKNKGNKGCRCNTVFIDGRQICFSLLL